jgi:post-segregation antitoxin (ccd killing protein)
MHLTKTSITLPDDLLKEAKMISNNFSGLVAEALREYIRQCKVRKAMGSFGSWKEREESSVDMVNAMRNDKERDYAGRSH